jgi:hypothetical protein
LFEARGHKQQGLRLLFTKLHEAAKRGSLGGLGNGSVAGRARQADT